MLRVIVCAAATPDWILSIATAVLALIAIVTALYARSQLIDTRGTQRRQRVYSLQERYDDKILPLMEEMFALLAKDPADAKTEWASDAQRRKNIVRVFNYLEQVASEYNFGLLDTEVAHQTLVYVLVVAWPRARWLVQWLRDQASDDRLLAQWEIAYGKAKEIYQPRI